MNRKDIAVEIEKSAGIYKHEAELAIASALRCMEDALRHGEPVVIKGFGTLAVDEGTVNFKPSPALLKRIKAEQGQA